MRTIRRSSLPLSTATLAVFVISVVAAPAPCAQSQRATLPARPRLLAQAQPTPISSRARTRLKFEVATIRPARPTAPTPQRGADQGKGAVAQSRGGAGVNAPAPPPPPPGSNCFGRTTMDAGRIDRYCVSLRELLLEVFAVAPARLFAPDWTETQVFDISAKLPEGATQEQLPEMFQSLLEDRFGLAFHRESKEGPIHALVVAKGGLKVKAAAPRSAQPAWVAAAEAVSGPYGNGFIGGIRFRSIDVPNSTGEPMFVLQTPAWALCEGRTPAGRPGAGSSITKLPASRLRG